MPLQNENCLSRKGLRWKIKKLLNCIKKEMNYCVGRNIYREGHKTICVDLTQPYDKENEEMDRKINTLNLNYSMTYDGKKISTLS